MVQMLTGNGQFLVDIVGESYHQSALRQIAGPKEPVGKSLECLAAIQPEANNKYDANAVAIYLLPHGLGNGVLVGHFSRADAKSYRRLFAEAGIDLDSLILCRAIIVGGWKDEPDDLFDDDDDDDEPFEGLFGVRLDIAFPITCDPGWADVPLTKT